MGYAIYRRNAKFHLGLHERVDVHSDENFLDANTEPNFLTLGVSQRARAPLKLFGIGNSRCDEKRRDAIFMEIMVEMSRSESYWSLPDTLYSNQSRRERYLL